MYRDQPESFLCDPLALALAQFAINKGFDKALPQTERSFMYLPFMHSKSVRVHELALRIYEGLGNEANLAFEIKYKEIIDRFGRYPHRNNILGRVSSDDEIVF